jgi:hypothetical protein
VAKWFVRVGGLETGPFSETEFFDYLKNKDPTGVEIWREGMSAWVPAGSIPQLVELMAPARRAARPSISAARIWITVFVVGFLALIGIGAAIVVPHLRTTAEPPVTEAPVEQESRTAAPEPARPAPPAPPAPPEPTPQPSRLSREDFSDAMRKSMSLLDSLSRRFPKQYDDLISESYEKLSNGYPEAETAIAMRRKAFVMIKALLPQADDDVLIDLNKIVAEKYRVLSQINPSLCYAFGTGADSPDISSAFPDDLLRRERDLYERAIATATPRPAPDPRKTGSLQAALRRALLARGVTESQFSLLDAPQVAPDQHAQYCDVTIQLFREIGNLPPYDAALVMRFLMSGK